MEPEHRHQPEARTAAHLARSWGCRDSPDSGDKCTPVQRREPGFLCCKASGCSISIFRTQYLEGQVPSKVFSFLSSVCALIEVTSLYCSPSTLTTPDVLGSPFYLTFQWSLKLTTFSVSFLIWLQHWLWEPQKCGGHSGKTWYLPCGHRMHPSHNFTDAANFPHVCSWTPECGPQPLCPCSKSTACMQGYPIPGPVCQKLLVWSVSCHFLPWATLLITLCHRTL